MDIIISWVIFSLAIMVTAYLLPGVVLGGFGTALVVAVVLGLVNAFVRPLLLILTLPINILTLGLFTLVINALMILLVTSIVPGFKVDNFWWAMAFSLLLSIIHGLMLSLAEPM